MSLLVTASQTLGPFGAISFEQTQIADVASPGVGGERVTIRGRVLDADGNPVNDAMVETWQANAHGKYAHPDDAQEKPLDDQF
jgi:protocatechuate 3,4-dioxygenase alpha subunit